MSRDHEQADPEREAEDRAGQRGDDLCHGQPGPDLLRGCPSTSVTAEARLASRTVAMAAKIAVSAARVTSEIVMAVSTCSARGMSGLTSPPELPK